MPTDNRFQILENIKDAFALITTAGGYNFTVGYQDIGARHFTEIPTDKFPALMVAGADEDRRNVTNETFKSVMDVSVLGFVKSGDVTDPAALESALSRLIADLTKALYVDPTRGGLSTFTEIGRVITDKGNIQPYAAFEMIVTVEYRAAFATP